jgi:hypothetical protein
MKADEVDEPTLFAYLHDHEFEGVDERDLARLELHASNLETALVNLLRGLDYDAVNKLQGAIFDNTSDIARDPLFDTDFRHYSAYDAED